MIYTIYIECGFSRFCDIEIYVHLDNIYNIYWLCLFQILWFGDLEMSKSQNIENRSPIYIIYIIYPMVRSYSYFIQGSTLGVRKPQREIYILLSFSEPSYVFFRKIKILSTNINLNITKSRESISNIYCIYHLNIHKSPYHQI